MEFEKSSIYRSEGFTCTHYSPKSKHSGKIVICFDTINGDLNDTGFGVDFLIKNKYEVIFVSSRKGGFYQDLAGLFLFEIVAPYLKNKRVFTYGESLGGYAALYYSYFLKAKAIAFSPRISIDPIYSDSDSYGVSFEHSPLSELCFSDLIPSPCIVIDPYTKKDCLFYKKRVEPLYGNSIDKVEIKYAGHGTSRAMLEMGRLQSFVLDIVDNGFVPNIDFGPDKTKFGLSCLALECLDNEEYGKCNDFLLKIPFALGEPKFDYRLQAYRALVKNNELNHVFDKSCISNKEKKFVMNKVKGKAGENYSKENFFLEIFNANILLMEYDQASLLADYFTYLFPDAGFDLDIKRVSQLYLENSTGWVV